MNDFRAAAVQFNHVPGDKAENLNTIVKFVHKAALQEVRLIVFPEMCITGYWHVRKLSREQINDLAEPVPDGDSTRKLLSWSADNNMTIGAGLIERGDDGQLYNSYVVAMPNGQHACHRKLHCFISEHMASGNQYTVFDTPQGCRMGVLICYDNNIGENVRITALHGAELLLAPHQTGGCNSASPGCMGTIDPGLWEQPHEYPSRIEAEFRSHKGRGWLMRWLPARAHDNGLFLVYANGVGVDDNEVRTGNAMILDPYGEILTETCRAADDMVVADIETKRLEMSTGRRWIRTRRPQLYEKLTELTGKETDTRAVRFENQGIT